MPKTSATSAPLNDTRNNVFLQEYVYELLSSFYFPKNITQKLHAAANYLSSSDVLPRDDVVNQTIDILDQKIRDILAVTQPTCP